MTLTWAWIIGLVVFGVVVGNLMLLKYSAKLPMPTRRSQDNASTAEAPTQDGDHKDAKHSSDK